MPRNTLIKDGKIAAIVDWESAGWYPEYWEYTRWTVSNYNSSRIWRDLRDDVLDPYPDVLVQCLLVFDLVKYSEGQLIYEVVSHPTKYPITSHCFLSDFMN